MATWIIGGAIILYAAFILIRHVRRARRGDCGCGCASCPQAGACHAREKEDGEA